MVVAAPKTPVTGFHVVEVMKLTTPNFPIARVDSCMSVTRIPMIKMITVNDATAVREENK